MVALRSAGGDGIDAEEVEDACSHSLWRRDNGRPGGRCRDEWEATEGFEDEPSGRTGLGTAGEAGHGHLGGDGVADLALHEAEDQQGQADDAEQRFDAPVVLQEDGGHGPGGP